jgi:hypothetical protein
VDNIQLFVFDEEVDLDAITDEVGRDWRAIFEELAAELDMIYAANDPLLTFRMSLFGEDVDLNGYARVLGRDWRLTLEKLAPALDAAFAPYTSSEPQAEPVGS